MRNVRGIVNHTTACHVTSSLVLLCHCLPPVREALLQSVRTHSDSASRQDLLLRELAFFLQDYCVSGDDDLESWGSHPSEVPASLYRALLSEAGVQAEDVGDAVTTIAKILDHLRRCADAPEVARTLKATLDGSCHRVIEDGHRRKIVNQRSMPCPFPVRIDSDQATLLEALRKTLLPQVVQGYQWTGDFEKLSSVLPPGDVDRDTTKLLVIDEAPPVWIIHLDRLVNCFRQRDPAIVPVVNAPFLFDASSLGINAEYRLMGALVHLSDRKHEVADENAGHTVALVCDQGNDQVDNHWESEWFIVDDDKVTAISTFEAGRMINGCQTEQGLAEGVLLVYHKLSWCWRDALEQGGRATTQQSTLTTVDWTVPNLLIGRRVRVKWARDKWYQGTVSSFDPATRKHTISYDDGDIRSYDLRRKTIEWI